MYVEVALKKMRQHCFTSKDDEVAPDLSLSSASQYNFVTLTYWANLGFSSASSESNWETIIKHEPFFGITVIAILTLL